MEVFFAHSDTWETFLIYHRLNLLQNESVSAKSIILASYIFMAKLKNELYQLAEADREILERKGGWLNDDLMDAGQQLICKALGSPETARKRSPHTSQFLATIFSSCTMVFVIGY